MWVHSWDTSIHCGKHFNVSVFSEIWSREDRPKPQQNRVMVVPERLEFSYIHVIDTSLSDVNLQKLHDSNVSGWTMNSMQSSDCRRQTGINNACRSTKLAHTSWGIQLCDPIHLSGQGTKKKAEKQNVHLCLGGCRHWWWSVASSLCCTDDVLNLQACQKR